LSFWTIHSGTTRPSIGCPGSEERTGTAWRSSPPGTVPFPDAEPVPLTEARDTGLAAGVNASLRDDGLCLGRDDSSTLARDSRLGALSNEAGPHPASPARSIRLRSSARDDRDGGTARCRVVGAYNEKVSCAEVNCRPSPICNAFPLCTPDWLNIRGTYSFWTSS
jgi:hypothetical protein